MRFVLIILLASQCFGWLDGWSHRATVTIDDAYVNSTLSNFPALVTADDFGQSHDIWTEAKTDFADVRFTTTSDTELAFEIVEVTVSTTSTCEIWVEVDSLSSSADTEIYCYFGNSGASAYGPTDTYGRNNTWAPVYHAVYHLNETSGSTATDSAGNADGTYQGTMVNDQAGIWGTAQNFTGDTNDDHITLGTDTAFNDGENSYEAWVRPEDQSGGSRSNYRGIIGAKTSTSAQYTTLYWAPSAADDFGMLLPGSIIVTAHATDEAWQYAHFRKASGNSELHIDGSSAATNGSTNMVHAADEFKIGYNDLFTWGDAFFEGQMEEVRIAVDGLSDDWVSAMHDNTATAAFLAIGAAEEAPASGVPNPIIIWH